ncbi:MAG TPA: tetratricopeptide repeat protein [Kiritimatiellia bacterium]|nr:tetratricopeptide repeat protein [Kiritimatiellia bacterium]
MVAVLSLVVWHFTGDHGLWSYAMIFGIVAGVVFLAWVVIMNLRITVVLLAVAGVVYLLWTYLPKQKESTTASPSSPASSLSHTRPVDAPSQQVMEEQQLHAPLRSLVSSPVASPAASARSLSLKDIDPERLFLEYQIRLAHIISRQPFLRAGSVVTVTNEITSRVLRGRLTRVDEDFFFLKHGEGEFGFPWNEFDPTTRFRLDPSLRGQVGVTSNHRGAQAMSAQEAWALPSQTSNGYLHAYVAALSNDWHSALQGDREALYTIGSMMLEGVLLPLNEELGFTCIENAARAGFPDAQFELGLAYALGDYRARDEREGLKWILKAAAQGHSDAQFNAGLMYCTGKGSKVDKTTGRQWFLKAAKQGEPRARCALAYMYLIGDDVPRDPKQALYWYQKAADQGWPLGQMGLAALYYDGVGVPRSYERAAELYRLAAEQGEDEAQITLGKMYAEGLGVGKNIDASLYWYRKAAAQSNEFARNVLKAYRADATALARGSNISPATTTPPRWQVTEGRSRNGMRTVEENQYLAKHYGRFGGAFETVEEASQKAHDLNTQQQYNVEALKEFAINSGPGNYSGNFQMGNWTYRYDRSLDKFVVYQE